MVVPELAHQRREEPDHDQQREEQQRRIGELVPHPLDPVESARQHAADFVIQGDGLSSVLDALAVSKGAKRRVLENFGFEWVCQIKTAGI